MSKSSRANIAVSAIESLSDKFNDINILETGCIRNLSKKHSTSDGHSTRHFCEFVRSQSLFNSVNFTSIDLEPEICEKFLTSLDLIKYVDLVKGNTLDTLPNLKFKKIHFAYLDTANDPDIILNEFKLIEDKLVSGSIVIVDDAENNMSHKRKGRAIYPYVKEKYSARFHDDVCYLRIDI